MHQPHQLGSLVSCVACEEDATVLETVSDAHGRRGQALLSREKLEKHISVQALVAVPLLVGERLHRFLQVTQR